MNTPSLYLIRSRVPGRPHDGYTSDGRTWSGHPSGVTGRSHLMHGPYVGLAAVHVARAVREFGHIDTKLYIVDAETGGSKFSTAL